MTGPDDNGVVLAHSRDTPCPRGSTVRTSGRARHRPQLLWLESLPVVGNCMNRAWVSQELVLVFLEVPPVRGAQGSGRGAIITPSALHSTSPHERQPTGEDIPPGRFSVSRIRPRGPSG